MKKVLATGLNGMVETTAYLGSTECFNRIRRNVAKSHGHSNWIDAIERKFVDDDSLSLTTFPSVTRVPPDVMSEVSAILCMSCPEITVQVLSIAEHYCIPIVLASMAIRFDGDKPCDDISRVNAEILLSIAQKKAVFRCEDDKNLLRALRIVTEENWEPGLYDLNDQELKAK